MTLNAREVSPAPLVVSAEEMSARTPDQTKWSAANLASLPVANLNALPSSSVTAVQAGAFLISPVAAGLQLAKIVLSIAGGAIVMLMAYLVWMDGSIADNVAGAYKQVLNPSRIGSEFYTLDGLEQFAADLNAARDNPNPATSKQSAQRDQEVVKMLGELPSLSSTQKAQLNQCVPLPTDASRNEKLGQCIAVIDNIRQAALGAAANTTTAQMAAESAQKIQDQRQSLHLFWIQAAQLILLNLLLPLLTALFGYIFGTQQGSGKSTS
jgi:hypothetical protein